MHLLGVSQLNCLALRQGELLQSVFVRFPIRFLRQDYLLFLWKLIQLLGKHGSVGGW